MQLKVIEKGEGGEEEKKSTFIAGWT